MNGKKKIVWLKDLFFPAALLDCYVLIVTTGLKEYKINKPLGLLAVLSGWVVVYFVFFTIVNLVLALFVAYKLTYAAAFVARHEFKVLVSGKKGISAS